MCARVCSSEYIFVRMYACVFARVRACLCVVRVCACVCVVCAPYRAAVFSDELILSPSQRASIVLFLLPAYVTCIFAVKMKLEVELALNWKTLPTDEKH